MPTAMDVFGGDFTSLFDFHNVAFPKQREREMSYTHIIQYVCRLSRLFFLINLIPNQMLNLIYLLLNHGFRQLPQRDF